MAILASIIRAGWRVHRDHKNTDKAWLAVATVAILVAYQIPGLFANNLYLTGLSHIFVYAFIGGTVGIGVQDRSMFGFRVPNHYRGKSGKFVPAH
jgi:hypothetical protein